MLPKQLQPVLWSVNIGNLSLEKDKYYIIHQILSYGRLDDILWLMRNCQARFLWYRLRIMPSRFYFVKDALLGLKQWHPDERVLCQKYISKYWITKDLLFSTS